MTEEAPESSALPLMVDLDGTLIKSDLLVESFFVSLSRQPMRLLSALIGLLDTGRAGLKHRMAGLADSLDVSLLPYNLPLLDYLRDEKAKGREIALVSASDHLLVARVAQHLDLFDWHQGSSRDVNLKGEKKADFLVQRLPGGFVYAGDSKADLAVWRRSDGAVVVGATSRVRTMLDEVSETAPVERMFAQETPSPAVWARALRLHQWVKNALILIPLFLSGLFVVPADVIRVLLGFVAFGLIASGGYLFNDLLDLQTDRSHPSKRLRPLAAGVLGPFAAMAASAGCIVAGLMGLLLLSSQAGLLALAYLAGTLTYSIWLKRLALADLVTLATLFTLRLAIGTALIKAAYSTWLLTFSMVFFFSLSAVKRVAELTRVGASSRRGYGPEDLSLLQSFGVSMSAAALVIFVLYLEAEALVQGNYPSPNWLWLAPPVVFIWMCRLWLLAVRGQLNDDPVVFALRDPMSLAIGTALGFSVLAAHLL